MENKIDARGLMCPKPVIMTKKKLEEIGTGSVTTIVDNEASKENLSKLAESMGLEFKVNEISKEEFHVTVNKEGDIEVKDIKTSKDLKEEVIIFPKDKMGEGDDKLGKILVRSFIYTVSETPPYPSKMIFYNEGVRLTCQGSEVLNELRFLENEGVEIISCGTCLDFLEIGDKLEVGSVSNMYTIYEKIREEKSNINIG